MGRVKLQIKEDGQWKDPVWVRTDQTIKEMLDAKSGTLIVDQAEYSPDEGETFDQVLKECALTEQDFASKVHISRQGTGISRPGSGSPVKVAMQKEREEKIKEMRGRIDEAKAFQKEVEQNIDLNMPAARLKTELAKLRSKYTTFQHIPLEEMMDLTRQNVQKALQELAIELEGQVNISSLKELPDIQNKNLGLFEALYFDGIDRTNVKLSAPISNASSYSLISKYASTAAYEAAQHMGFRKSTASTNSGSCAGACAVFGASFSLENSSTAGHEVDVQKVSKTQTQQVVVTKRTIHQLYTFCLEKACLDEMTRGLFMKLASAAGSSTERLAADILRRYPELCMYGVCRGPYGVGGYFEVLSTSQSKEEMNMTNLLEVAEAHVAESYSAGVSCLTAKFDGGGEFARKERKGVAVGEGGKDSNAMTTVTSTITIKCHGPPVTTSDDLNRALYMLPDMWKIIPANLSGNSKQLSPLLLPDIVDETVLRFPEQEASLHRALALLMHYIAHGPKVSVPRVLLKSNRHRRVLLFGKTGHGKSLLGSVLLGLEPPPAEPIFRSSNNSVSETQGVHYRTTNDHLCTVYDTQGCMDTMGWQGKIEFLFRDHEALLKGVLDAMKNIGTSGLDAVFFVWNFKEPRFSVVDTQVAKMADVLFTDAMMDYSYIIFTNASKQYCQDQNKAKEWIDAQIANPSSHFKHFFKLVNRDTNRVVFVNFSPFDECTTAEETQRAVINNFVQCQKLLDILHGSTREPLPLVEAKAAQRLKDLDELIKKEDTAANADKKRIEELEAEKKFLEKKVKSATSSASGCFPGAAVVTVRDRGSVFIQDLRVGDRVLVAADHWSTVLCWTHRDVDATLSYVQLSYGDGALTASFDHLVFVSECRTTVSKPAGDVVEGDKLLGPAGETLEVKGMNTKDLKGIYNFLTASGDVVVDGVRVSCYAAFDLEGSVGGLLSWAMGRLFRSNTFMHLCLSPLRFYHSVVPPNDDSPEPRVRPAYLEVFHKASVLFGIDIVQWETKQLRLQQKPKVMC